MSGETQAYVHLRNGVATYTGTQYNSNNSNYNTNTNTNTNITTNNNSCHCFLSEMDDNCSVVRCKCEIYSL